MRDQQKQRRYQSETAKAKLHQKEFVLLAFTWIKQNFYRLYSAVQAQCRLTAEHARYFILNHWTHPFLSFICPIFPAEDAASVSLHTAGAPAPQKQGAMQRQKFFRHVRQDTSHDEFLHNTLSRLTCSSFM